LKNKTLKEEKMKQALLGISLLVVFVLSACSNTSEQDKKQADTVNDSPAITLYITRHGKTLLNTTNRVQGWADSPLTEQGKDVAIKLGKGLKTEKIQFDGIFSGDSGRHIQTTTLILQNNGQAERKFEQMPELREWNYGGFEGELNQVLGDLAAKQLGYPSYEVFFESEELNKHEKLANTYAQLDSYHLAENYQQISDRITKGFDKIIKKAQKEKFQTVLVVSSGDTIMTFLEHLDPKVIPTSGLANASVTTVVYQDGQYTVKKVNDLHFVEIGEQISGKEESK
jgi:broad specificity phosphatase PhoE